MISFAKLKITNNKHSQGDIVLQSMRKYMVQIVVREDLGDTEYVFPLPETTFVAVTQYQNEAVTRMKIAHNPFANGFKYAHVTGTEQGKKLFSRSELSRTHGSKHKNTFSGSKSSGMTARVKATVNPQPVARVVLNAHVQEDIKVVTQALALTTAVPSLHHMSPALCLNVDTDTRPCLPLTHESEVLPIGLHSSSTATTCPYIFQSDTDESPNEEVNGVYDLSMGAEKCSPNVDRCSEVDSCTSLPECSNAKQLEASEEEDRDEPCTDNISPTPISSVPIPTIVTDREENASGDTSPQTTDSKDNDVHEHHLTASSISGVVWNSSPGVATNLSKKGELFKHPLPRKHSRHGRKNGKKPSSVAEGSASSTDVDMHWYKTALRQATQRAGDSSVKTDRGVQLKLHGAHIWHSFAACGSKMLVSAEGRTMFPVVTISLRGLEPGRLYSVWLHVTLADADVTLGRDQTQWSQLFPGSVRGHSMTAQSPKPYMHPASPMRGLAWMKVKVTFGEVKLASATSDLASSVENSLTLQYGRRYLTQVVVREEEEVTPSGAGSFGNLYLFPLPEVTFVTKQESCDSKLPLSVTSLAPTTNETRKRDNANMFLADDLEDSNGTTLPPSKVARVGASQWVRPPAILPRPADMATLLPRPSDLSTVLPRPADLCNRINPVYCFPPVSTLPPAHVGLLANRMSLPVAPHLQSVTPFPFQPQLFPQLRTPMHSAFSMALPSFNPYPDFYYPYSLPAVSLPQFLRDAKAGLVLEI